MSCFVFASCNQWLSLTYPSIIWSFYSSFSSISSKHSLLLYNKRSDVVDESHTYSCRHEQPTFVLSLYVVCQGEISSEVLRHFRYCILWYGCYIKGTGSYRSPLLPRISINMLLRNSRSNTIKLSMATINLLVVSNAKFGNQLAEEASGAINAVSIPMGDLYNDW